MLPDDSLQNIPVEIVSQDGAVTATTTLHHRWGKTPEALKGLPPDLPRIVPVFGLPRSCSELLLALLAQHPEIECTTTSGLPGWLDGQSKQWRGIPGWAFERPSPYPRIKRQTAAALREHHGFLRFQGVKVVLEKNRVWPSLFPMLQDLLGRPVEGICTLRDPRCVLASFEKLWDQRGFDVPLIGDGPAPWWVRETEVLRAQSLLSPDGVIGSCVLRLRGFFATKFAEDTMIVEAARFADEPTRVADRIVAKLGLTPFDGWQPQKVEASVSQDDLGWGWGEHLHTIREKIEPLSTRSWKRLGKETLSAFEGKSGAPSPYDDVNTWMSEAI